MLQNLSASLTDVKTTLDTKSPLILTSAAVAASSLLLLVGYKSFKSFIKPSSSRNYTSKESVGDEYNKWTNDGVLEKFWGEHIHHGHFGAAGTDKIPSIEAKEVLITKLVDFASLEQSASWDGNVIKILDLGCGIGGSSRFLAKKLKESGKAVKTVGVTLSREQVKRASELTGAAGLSSDCSFQVADALNLPFEDNYFDIVWSLESGEHMPDKQKFIAEAHRVLKPAGKIMVATWCTKLSSALTSQETKSLEIIYREWALPFFISLPEYESIFKKAGFVVDGGDKYKQADWSVAVRKTWTQAVWDGVYGMPWLLLRGPRVFYRTLKDVFAIYHMVRGYWTGYVIYGVITTSKPSNK